MNAYFSCGAGDFISIESFLTDSEKKKITSFSLFTRSAKYIEDLIRLHPIWKNLPVNIALTDSEIKSHGVYSFYDIPHLRRITKMNFPELDKAIDFSGERIYPQILSGERRFTESLFANCVEPISCDIVIDGVSNNDDRLVARGRNLTVAEIERIKTRVGIKYIEYPEMGKTTIAESLGFICGCSQFFGVDSMLACFAARCDNVRNIEVKTVNPIYRKWLQIYDPKQKIKVVDTW